MNRTKTHDVHILHSYICRNIDNANALVFLSFYKCGIRREGIVIRLNIRKYGLCKMAGEVV